MLNIGNACLSLVTAEHAQQSARYWLKCADEPGISPSRRRSCLWQASQCFSRAAVHAALCLQSLKGQ